MLFLEGHPGARVRVLSGSLWLTEPGRPVPRFVQPREQVTLTQRGGFVLEGVGRSTVEVAQPLRRRGHRLHGYLATLRRSSARLLAQGLALAAALSIGVGLPDILARGFQTAGGAASVAAAGAAPQDPVRL